MEEDDDQGADAKDQQPRTKTPLSSSKSFFKPPTNEEMQQLSQTNELFKSNLFKLQIDELVGEVSINYSKVKPLESALHKIKSILDSLDDRPDLAVAEASAKLQKEGITIPFGHTPPPKDAKYKLGFQRPAKVAIVGSFLLRTLTKRPSGINVDIAVQMPEALFQEKDHVNNRYFHKRAYYLAVIASELKNKTSKHGFAVNVEFEAFLNDLRKPVIVLTSTKAAGDMHFSKLGVSIRIFPTISASVFPPARLAPGRNNVRPATLGSGAAGIDQAPATPHYNALVLQDTVLVAHLNFLHHHITESPAFKEACLLARVWLTQRGLTETQKSGFGMSGFLISMIMGWLLRAAGKHASRRIGKTFSSYQMLKITMDFIAEHDFSESPLFLTPTGEEIAEPEFSASEFLSAYDVAIVDPSGRINLAAHISRAAMDEIQHEAKLTSAMFRDQVTDHFDSLFLKQVDRPLLKYDNLVRVPQLTSAPAAYKGGKRLDFPDLTQFAVRYLPSLLKGALTDRTTLVTAYAPAYARWSCDESWESANDSSAATITIAMLLDPENSLRVVEMGPHAEDTAAVTAFRELWGERAEMRRFKDGSITESVVFDCDGTLQQRSLIVARMCAHLIARHAKLLPTDGVSFWAGLGSKYIKAPGIELTTGSFQPVMDAFQEFTRELKGLKELPLSVSTVLPVADALRYTSVFVPQPKADTSTFFDGYRPLHHPLPVVIEFESSGRWPDELRAIQNMKRAFYIRIGQQLEAKFPGTRAVVSVGSNDNVEESGWLDVTHTSGYIFRCRIHHDREATLLDRAITTVERSGSPAEVVGIKAAKQSYLTQYVRLPWHATQLGNLCLRHPFLPVTIRILKRWLAAHLLNSASVATSVPEQVLEILAAHVYLNPHPYGVPTSGFAGFLRVLDLVQSWSWKDEPLIVELEAGKMDAAMVNSIKAAFKASRAKGTRSPPMYVATERDSESVWWTDPYPTAKILERFIVLARAALAHVTDKFVHGGGDLDISQLFSAPLLGYALVLHLDPQRLPRFRENLTYSDEAALPVRTKYKNLVTNRDREAALLAQFDPVDCLLADLHAAFGHLALFFHDRYGGDKIAVVWKAGVMAPGPFKVNLAYNAAPDAAHLGAGHAGAVLPKGVKPAVRPNVDAMVSEMQRIGEGLVLAIERR
ncbi:Nrap protein [Entophlyctis helioformis]|nr:Nrap protein [Entophlyctis helioformis]